MDELDGYVLISHDDLPHHERVASATGESNLEPRQNKSAAPEQHPRPYTRAYIDLIHTIEDKWTSSSGVVKHRSCTDRHSSPAYLSEISSYVDSLADALWPVNKTIHDNPEMGFEEHIAHRTLTNFMRTQSGWEVYPSVYGMSTAWLAVYDSGKKGPVVSFNAEMGMPRLDSVLL